MKTCTKCKQDKEMFEFSLNRSRTSGHNSWCKACISKHIKDYNKKNPNMKLERLAYAYGLTKLQYEQLLSQANHSCQICKTNSIRLVIDHCHKTGTIRGILCDTCNLALGLFNHSSLILKSLVLYLNSANKEVNLGYYLEKLSREQSLDRQNPLEVTSETKYIRGLRKKRNISLQEYQQLILSCNNCCCICNKQTELHLDHCHITMQIRGLLCSNCNHGVGLFKDQIDLVMTAIAYLAKTQNVKPNLLTLLSQL